MPLDSRYIRLSGNNSEETCSVRRVFGSSSAKRYVCASIWKRGRTFCLYSIVSLNVAFAHVETLQLTDVPLLIEYITHILAQHQQVSATRLCICKLIYACTSVVSKEVIQWCPLTQRPYSQRLSLFAIVYFSKHACLVACVTCSRDCPRFRI